MNSSKKRLASYPLAFSLLNLASGGLGLLGSENENNYQEEKKDILFSEEDKKKLSKLSGKEKKLFVKQLKEKYNNN